MRFGRPRRRQTRVLTWPVVTIFGFLALADGYFSLKPIVTRDLRDLRSREMIDIQSFLCVQGTDEY